MAIISLLVRVENSRQMRKPDGICSPGQVLNVRERNGLFALGDRPVKMSTEEDEERTEEWVHICQDREIRSVRMLANSSELVVRSLSHKSCIRSFTMIEILIVVVIITIAAMVAIPMMTSAASMQIRSAANMIAADLEYAKSMAISRGQNFSVVFDKTTESYSIKNQDDVIISHPVKKGFDYTIDFRSDGRLNKVDIADVVFDPDSSHTITFDYLGSPYSGSGTSNPLNSGVVTLQAGGTATTITVEPVTGFISIED